MDLLELNSELSEVFKQLRDKKIDKQQADGLVNVANAMINNSKLLLQAAKHAENENAIRKIIGAEPETIRIGHDSVYEEKTKYAISLGYKNLVEAISDMSHTAFERQFKKRFENEI